MTEPNQNELDTKKEKPGKISLQEAMKRKLAEKKQAQAQANSPVNQKAKNQSMKSQLTKKPNNQRRRMGV
ncbi:hypothetical protein AV540_06050 [Brevibacillus parabrevis]|uniref:hypothetical protein n=1 Tax=Brevibacillus parabrevis TaxID=54914 RepID=UPI0007AC0BFC|nr:hypothetical protein [Brevibacillus parabrevis]KZE55608.1 hypothetical protein AV540_06050 [Brevibacillus parabrevis]